jgi:hypothetical protein
MLLIVTMFWGGCISCPQFFMLPGGEDNCCDEAGRCKKRSEEPPVEQKQCQTMPLELQPSGVHHSPPVSVAEIDEIPVGHIAPHVAVNVGQREDSAQRVHSPPDRQSLYSTYLI